MSEILNWRDGGEIMMLSTGIPTGPHRLHCQAERDDHTYSIQDQGTDGWMVMQSVRDKVKQQQMCKSLDAAKAQAEQWEAHIG